MVRTNVLRFIETGLSCSCLEQLGWFAGRNPKDCTVGYITKDPPVPSTLGFRGWWRSERSNFLTLDSWRWSCLNLWLLSWWSLNLREKEKCKASLWTNKKDKKEEETGKKNKLITMYNNNSFAHNIWMGKVIKSIRKITKAPTIWAAMEIDITKEVPGSYSHSVSISFNIQVNQM